VNNGIARRGWALTNDAASMLSFDLTGEPVPAWARGVGPEPAERGPPEDWDVVDPPAPDE
jgi:hypothetical protein